MKKSRHNGTKLFWALFYYPTILDNILKGQSSRQRKGPCNGHVHLVLHNLDNIQSAFGIFPLLSTECPEIEVAVVAEAGNLVATAAIILIAREGDLNAIAIMRL